MLSTLLAATILRLVASPAPPAFDFERLLAQGREALQTHRYADARTAFEAALKDRPEDARGWTLLARAVCGEAELAAARENADASAVDELLARSEESARKATDLDARSPDAWAGLGHVLTRAGKVDDALATLYRAQELGAGGPELLLDLADALLAARQSARDMGDDAGATARLDDAERVLEKAERSFDVEVAILRRLVDLRKERGKLPEALAACRRALALEPRDTDMHDQHLELAVKAGAYDETVDFYVGLVDEPALGRWYLSRARELRGHYAYNHDKDYAKAATEYAAAESALLASARVRAELKPQVDAYLPTLRSFRGYALLKAGRHDEAEAAFLSALDVQRDHENARHGLKELQDALFHKLGGGSMPKEKSDEMRAFMARLCMATPDDVDAWNNYGLFARDAGKYEESYLAYRHAMALAPDNARVLNDTALVLMYHLNRDLERAEQWLDRAVSIADAGRNDKSHSDRQRSDDESALGDAYSNLINLVQARGDLDHAKKLFADYEAKLPKHDQVSYWRTKLYPDLPAKPAEPAPATKDDASEKTPPKDGGGGDSTTGGAPNEGGTGSDDESGSSDSDSADGE